MKTKEQYIEEGLNAAIDEGVPPEIAEFMISQAQVESANFTSNVFMTDNNGFGMKFPAKRQTPYVKRASTIAVASEGGIPYAHYDSFGDSVRDLVNWFHYKKIKWEDVDTVEKYSTELKNVGYYGPTQEEYENMMMRYYRAIKDSAVMAYRKHPELSLLTAFTFFAAVGYTIYRVAKLKK